MLRRYLDGGQRLRHVVDVVGLHEEREVDRLGAAVDPSGRRGG